MEEKRGGKMYLYASFWLPDGPRRRNSSAGQSGFRDLRHILPMRAGGRGGDVAGKSMSSQSEARVERKIQGTWMIANQARAQSRHRQPRDARAARGHK